MTTFETDAICMTTFDTDRNLIAGLSDKDASSILGLLDGGLPHDEAPSEFRAALAAAQRSPDVSRYILVGKSRKEPSSFDSYSSEKTTLLHRCPGCGAVHEISAARAQFAYGRQLACSPDCEAERRRRSRASYRLVPALVSRNAFAETGAGRPFA